MVPRQCIIHSLNLTESRLSSKALRMRLFFFISFHLARPVSPSLVLSPHARHQVGVKELRLADASAAAAMREGEGEKKVRPTDGLGGRRRG